uniref:Uncharacterized protein n=1 Tax=Hemiselmis tepida TaxID=464990 RepID=A0A7S0Z4K6_9CRYP
MNLCLWQGSAPALIEHLRCEHNEGCVKLKAQPSGAQQHVPSDGWLGATWLPPQFSWMTNLNFNAVNFEAVVDPQNPEQNVFFRVDSRVDGHMSSTCVRYIGVSPSAASWSNDWFCELTAERCCVVRCSSAELLSRRALWSGPVHSIGHTLSELRDAGEGLFLQSSQVRLLERKYKAGEGDGNSDGSRLYIYLRFFRDAEAAAKLGLPPMNDQEAHAGHVHTTEDLDAQRFRASVLRLEP